MEPFVYEKKLAPFITEDQLILCSLSQIHTEFMQKENKILFVKLTPENKTLFKFKFHLQRSLYHDEH